MPDPAEPLAQAGARLQRLEEENGELRRRLAEERGRVDRFGEHLALLADGVFPPRTWPVLVIVLGAIVATFTAGALFWGKAERLAAELAARGAASAGVPLLPRLLITSEPAAAEVILDGVSRGSTPLLLTMPGRAAKHRVVVSSPMRRQDAREVQILPAAGAHVHARLLPAED